MFFRPKPQCWPAMIVLMKTGEIVLITQRRWVRPNGESRKQWVYDGTVLEVSTKNLIRIRGGISCVPEKSIASIIAV